MLQNYLQNILYWFVVVDVGSSGSRLRLYSCSKTNENLMTGLEEKFTSSVSLGLQNVLTEYIPQYMARLFSGLNTTLENYGLDNTAQQNIPVRFYGTAGMRSMFSTAQNRTYQAVTNWIRENTAFVDIEAKTIPGEHEALYNWLSVNYLNGAFADNQPTAAIFDLGGGSGEIAYETTRQSGPNVFELSIANCSYFIAAEPWFIGNDWARYQNLDRAGCYNPDYPMPDIRYYAGNFSDCEISVQQPFLIHPNLHPVELSVSFKNQDMHLLSTFYYAYDFLVYPDSNMPGSDYFNLTLFHQSAEKYCSLSWNTVMTNPVYNQDDYASTYCFAASLIEGIYKDAQFQALSENHNLWVTKKINSTTVSWSIGVVAQLITGTQFNQLPSAPTSQPSFRPAENTAESFFNANANLFAGGSIVLLIILAFLFRNSENVSGFVKTKCAFWRGKNNSQLYNPLNQTETPQNFQV